MTGEWNSQHNCNEFNGTYMLTDRVTDEKPLTLYLTYSLSDLNK
jgi:hypothetical protein